MSMLDDIFSKVLKPTSEPAAQPDTPAASSTPAASTGAPAPAVVPAQSVDVAANLDALAAKSGQKLNWKQSIVDMMGLLGMDNSLTARKHLATELGYTGDQSDSATMNVWLHKEVMKKLADNGGKVPANLMS